MECEVAPLVINGELRKRCTGWLKRWTRRYWELRSDGYLSYFSSPRNTHTRRGLIDVKHECRRVLVGLEAQAEGGGAWPNDPEATFLLLITDRRLFCLVADTPYECQAWVHALSAFVAVGGSSSAAVCPPPTQRRAMLFTAPPDEYDALGDDGTNDDFGDDDNWGKDVDIVYDSPMRDLTLRGEATMRIKRQESPPRVPARLDQGHERLATRLSDDTYEPYEFGDEAHAASSGARRRSVNEELEKKERKAPKGERGG